MRLSTRTVLPVSLVALLAVAMTACGKRLTDANLAEVRADMSMKEVESVLGQPSRVKSHELTLLTQMKTLPATRYYYEQDGQSVELIFVSDKLIGKNGTFDPTRVAAPRLVEKSKAVDAPLLDALLPETELPPLPEPQVAAPGAAGAADEPAAPISVVEPPLPSAEPTSP